MRPHREAVANDHAAGDVSDFVAGQQAKAVLGSSGSSSFVHR